MVQAINLKKGMIFSQDGKLIKVLKANHHKPGKGNTVMQMDLRDVKSGAVVHKTMRPTEKVDLVEVTKKKAQYLYGEGDTYTFMDTDTYDQYEVSADQLGDDVKFLMPNIMVDMDFTDDNKIIGIELPSTVEMTTPNVYADQIEWMSTHFKDRERVILSLHTHNDRGEGVAATELGIMAGADRVEGTLFGNGERTGNLDIVVVALNMFTQGIDPKLDLSNINNIKHVYEKVTKMQIPPRQPYAGQLVFTAFSGSHQDAINKGMHAMQERNNPIWEVPYLPIDPSDIGRQYEPIVRINSQSGKGGVAYVMESMYGFHLPKGLQVDFSKIIQDISEEEGEVSPERVYDTFIEQYVDIEEPYRFVKQRLIDISDEDSVYERRAEITIEVNGEIKELTGLGNGPIDAVKNALNSLPGQYSHLLDYSEHALTSGSSSKAAAYVYLRAKGSAKQEYGVGIHPNITTATIKAIISAMNRLHRALK